MAWFDDWDYRKSHIIQQQAGAGTFYQIKIKGLIFGWEQEAGNPILSWVASGYIYSPWVIKEGADWHMWYGGEDGIHAGGDWIYYAESPDGINWTKKVPAPYDVLRPSAGEWDAFHVNDPAVVKVGAIYYLYYSGNPVGVAGEDRIGLATATNPWGPFTKHPTNPVLDFGYDANEYYVARPSVMYEDGIFKMWYDGRFDGGEINGIYYAESNDGVVWSRKGKVLNGVFASPSVARENSNTLRMVVNNNFIGCGGRELYIYESHDEGYTWQLIQDDMMPKVGWCSCAVDTGFLIKVDDEWWMYYGGGTAWVNFNIGLAYERDSGEEVGFNGHARSDFGDVRFTEDDGETELDYWIEEKVDDDYAIFWVEISGDLSAGNVTIYIYYGNAGATYPFGVDQTEMDATFIFADHFYGSALDGGKWNDSGAGIGVGGSEVTITGANNWIRSIGTFNQLLAFHAKAKTSADGSRDLMITDAGIYNDYVNFYRINQPNFQYGLSKAGVSTLGDSTGVAVDTIYHKYEIRRINGSLAIFYIDENLIVRYVDPTFIPIIDLHFESSRFWAGVNTIDYIFVRKSTDPEPVHGAWGGEENVTCSDYLNEIDCEANGCCWYDGTCYDCGAVVCEYWDNQIECEANGCNWCCVGGVWVCQAEECPTCIDYDNQADCEACGCCWYDGECYDCAEVPCTYWTNQTDCEANDCCWCDGVCQDCPCPEPPSCSDYVTQASCEANGCCWCNGVCQDCPCPIIPPPPSEDEEAYGDGLVWIEN